MDLLLKRKYFTSKSTVGELYIDGEFFSHVLEDVDRALDSNTMTTERIKWLKEYANTAIPYGKYGVVISHSRRFRKYMPLLLEVPGYRGVRIHPGNTHTDTEGCLLPGVYDPDKPNFVGNSRSTYSRLMSKLKSQERRQKIYITIINDTP